MEFGEIEAVIEGLLFAAGDRLPLEKISEVLQIDKKTVRKIIYKMMDDYQSTNRGIFIREIDNGFQLCTKFEVYDYIARLIEPRQKQGLSQAAYETLAIVAYNGPVTRAKIEKIRGVNSGSAIERLIERNLIREVGRLEVPGRPVIYDTTEEFLRSFGFRSKADLPVIDEDQMSFIRKEAEKEIAMREEREIAEERNESEE
ncbi:MAG TPA: SMC-Scp complex subunit ScpB [Clostridiaceae bacterium]|nr:SMC-Scp complex subunit ScpB [Clostridiaceae bacterium]